MKKFIIQTDSKKILSDLVSPVSAYLKLKEVFDEVLLLECNDFNNQRNNYSYVVASPMSTFCLNQNPDNTSASLKISMPDSGKLDKQIKQGQYAIIGELEEYIKSFEYQENSDKFTTNGLFGFQTYEIVQYFRDINFTSKIHPDKNIPLMRYGIYQFVIVFDHFQNVFHIFEHKVQGLQNNSQQNSSFNLDEVAKILNSNVSYPRSFATEDEEISNLTDAEYLTLVDKGIHHAKVGDTFQMILSREFKQKFTGDEFNVYRALRALNPSPYLFFFHYEDFNIFGSSPEIQLGINGDQVVIEPIAGTYKRTGDDAFDEKQALALMEDEKELAEHMMLVDLARNDLNVNAGEVEVKRLKEVKFFSNVIHLVSHIAGKIKQDKNKLRIIADTFPAGTLSGAPKHRAMELIDKYEQVTRAFYGGAIGIIDFQENYNHAILIRSALSKNNTLYYQAGAGVVALSEPQKELEEVFNKIAAMRHAIASAKKIESTQ